MAAAFFFLSVIYMDTMSTFVSSTAHEVSLLDSFGTDNSRDNARAILQTRKNLLAFQHAVAAPERAPFPVIAAVHGHVIGLGVELISACDIRFAASNSTFSIKVGGGLSLYPISTFHRKLFHRKSILV